MFASPGPLGRPLEGFLGRLGGFWGRLGDILGVLERSFGDSGPLGPSGRPPRFFLARVGALLGERGRGSWGQAGARERVGSMEPVHPQPRIWARFLPGRPKTQGLGDKNERILRSMRRGALIIASQGAKGPETHLPLQARWRLPQQGPKQRKTAQI